MSNRSAAFPRMVSLGTFEIIALYRKNKTMKNNETIAIGVDIPEIAVIIPFI
jgi:hypothetical protein